MRKALLLAAIFLSACSNYSANLPSIKPYKMDIQQGNVVTPKMMMQLRPGMTKQQVRFIMGTPLIADSFHANRWDYFYRMQKDGKVIEQRRVILDFEDDKLKGVRGDVVPAGGTDAATADRPGSKAPVTLKSTSDAPKKEEKGMLDKLKFWKSDEPEKPAKPVERAKSTEPPQKAVQPAPAEDQQMLPAVAEEKAEPLPPLTEGAAAPAPEKAAPQPAAKPEQTKPTPQPAQAPDANKPQEKGMLDKLKFWKSDDEAATTKPEAKPVPKTTPAPKPEPRPEPKIELKTEPRTAPAPAPKPVSKPIPKPSEDLPAEDDPGYFEKMLEKIGF